MNSFGQIFKKLMSTYETNETGGREPSLEVFLVLRTHWEDIARLSSREEIQRALSQAEVASFDPKTQTLVLTPQDSSTRFFIDMNKGKILEDINQFLCNKQGPHSTTIKTIQTKPKSHV